MTAIDALDEVTVAALTLYGEARGEGPEGRIAVANVLRNRELARRAGFGLTLRQVCLQPRQFSCWNESDPNRALLDSIARQLGQPDPPIGQVLRECLWIADGLVRAQFADNTKGATHYLTTKKFTEDPPAWAVHQAVLAVIGRHMFLRAV